MLKCYDFLIEAPQSEMFEQELYPGIYKKAACYAYFIIKNHIFYDGNKRTGMKSALLFLRLNGYTIKDFVTDQNIVDLVLGLAENRLSLEELTSFFEENTVEYIL